MSHADTLRKIADDLDGVPSTPPPSPTPVPAQAERLEPCLIPYHEIRELIRELREPEVINVKDRQAAADQLERLAHFAQQHDAWNRRAPSQGTGAKGAFMAGGKLAPPLAAPQAGEVVKRFREWCQAPTNLDEETMNEAIAHSHALCAEVERLSAEVDGLTMTNQSNETAAANWEARAETAERQRDEANAKLENHKIRLDQVFKEAEGYRAQLQEAMKALEDMGALHFRADLTANERHDAVREISNRFPPSSGTETG